MQSKMKYQRPCILKMVLVSLEEEILAASVVTKASTIRSIGQEVTEIDASGSDFNQEWTWNN